MNGMPMCKQWWTDIYNDTMKKNPDNQKLANGMVASPSANPFLYANMMALQQPSVSVEEQAKEAAMKIALANSQHVFDYGRFYGADNGAGLLTEAASNLGNLENRLKSAVLKSVLTSTLPIVQALLLMGIYAFLPLMIFLSGFDLRAMFIGSIALFSVKIFASLWMVAQWMDNKLVDTMYPKGEFALAAQGIAQGIGTNVSIANGFKETVLSTLLIMLFVGLPMLWVSMMGWLGYQMQNALGNMLRSGDATASQSANMGYNRAGQIAGAVKARLPLGKK